MDQQALSATELRVIVAVIGVIVLALIYFFGRPRRPGQGERRARKRGEDESHRADARTVRRRTGSKASSTSRFAPSSIVSAKAMPREARRDDRPSACGLIARSSAS